MHRAYHILVDKNITKDSICLVLYAVAEYFTSREIKVTLQHKHAMALVVPQRPTKIKFPMPIKLSMRGHCAR